MNVLAYADDTLITCRGISYEDAARKVTIGTSLMVERIHQLGLEVSLPKTEALLFHGPRRGPPHNAHSRVYGEVVAVKAQMKYLGLILDGRWQFKAHFASLALRLMSTAAALSRLLPNVGEPNATCRLLYSRVLRSMGLYGAPIWVDAFSAENRALLCRPQRAISLRAVRGYRTVSFTAATTLAADPPWHLQAHILAEVHRYRAGRRAAAEFPEEEEVRNIRALAQVETLRRWRVELGGAEYGLTTVEAILPHLERWVERRQGTLAFHMVQILTDHGCFGKYLHHIGSEESPMCHECGAQVDTARHTLEECPAWGFQQTTLQAILGADLSLPSVVNAMLDSEEAWKAMVSFSDQIMSQKEAAERARENDPDAHPLRRRRAGGRARRYAHLLHPP
ncbi:uncharacterized protein LOC134803661 [Cydia splendana]|uniref:uncharacterized protein LOC134803661 n=1 Tax=Cydia splendana TaxID=1100963 RepID=UPI00300C3C14